MDYYTYLEQQMTIGESYVNSDIIEVADTQALISEAHVVSDSRVLDLGHNDKISKYSNRDFIRRSMTDSMSRPH